MTPRNPHATIKIPHVIRRNLPVLPSPSRDKIGFSEAILKMDNPINGSLIGEPGRKLESDRDLTIMLWVVAVGFLMQSLDSTIVNTALPSMAKSLGESPLHMQAVVFSYSLTMAVMIPASGWLADRFGTQRVFLSAISLFVLGSLFCSWATDLRLLVASRVLQGIGGSMLLPVGRLAVLRNFPQEKFLPAISFVNIPGLIGPLLGPTLGGWLAETFSWHWIFLINVPVGILGVIATLRYMPNDRLPDLSRFDRAGYTLLAVAMVASSFALAGSDMGVSYVIGAILVILTALSLFGYIRHAQKTAKPLFPLDLFRISSFSVGLAGNLFARIGNGSMPYLLPLLMQVEMGYSPISAGVMLLPSTIAGMAAKRPATWLIIHCGYRRVLAVNTMLVGIMMSMFAWVSSSTPFWVILVLLFGFGFVNSIQFTSMNTLTLKDLPVRGASSGNSMLSMVQMLSLSIAVTIASSLMGVFESAFGTAMLSRAFLATFICMGLITFLSTWIFMRVERDDPRMIR